MSERYDLLDSAIIEVEQDAEQGEKRKYTDKEREQYGLEKQAQRDKLYATADETALEVAGSSDKFRKFLDLQSRINYTAQNTLLVLAQAPNATRLRDYDHWQSRGCPVTSGPGSGIAILEPGKNYARTTDGKVATGFEVKHVFDVSQVDVRNMKPDPPMPRRTEQQLLTALMKSSDVLIARAGVLPDGQVTTFDRGTNSILIRSAPFPAMFRSLAQDVALAHLSTGEQANPQFSAYCTAYMLCKKYGIDTQEFDFSDTPAVLEGMSEQEVKGELSQIRDVFLNASKRMEEKMPQPIQEERTDKGTGNRTRTGNRHAGAR